MLSFRTGSDSASCGIEPEIGIPFLVFAQQDPDRPGIGYVGTCNGTRRYSPESGQGSQGFVDVPARHVIPQLLDMMF